MGQHYTLNTLEVSAWCTPCGKMTPHRVADRRLQYCIPCWEKLGGEKVEPPKTIERQAGLFDVESITE